MAVKPFPHITVAIEVIVSTGRVTAYQESILFCISTESILGGVTADKLKNNVILNKKNTGEIVSDIIGKLQTTIQESKKVEKVSELTNDILNIAAH